MKSIIGRNDISIEKIKECVTVLLVSIGCAILASNPFFQAGTGTTLLHQVDRLAGYTARAMFACGLILPILYMGAELLWGYDNNKIRPFINRCYGLLKGEM